jgi:hypothetical protein
MRQVILMSFRSLSRANESYQLTVFCVFIGMLLVAMAMMLVHPTVTLVLFWLGLISLGAFAMSEKFIGTRMRRSARSELERSVCPRCRATVHREPLEAQDWCCDECGAIFKSSGEEKL